MPVSPSGRLPFRHLIQGRGRTIAVGCVLLVGLWLMCFSSSGSRHSTCAACRLDRVERHVLGFRWAEYEESDCSRWFAAHVESEHPHVWARRAHCRRIGIPGIYGGFSCSIGDPIASRAQSWQLRVYQRFSDPMKVKSLFVRLGKWDRESSELIDGLCEWEDSGSTESWDDWWALKRQKSNAH